MIGEPIMMGPIGAVSETNYEKKRLSNSLKLSNIRKLWMVSLIPILLSQSAIAQQPNKEALANEVRTEFLHAWSGYKKYAWGHDDLKPLTRTHRDWYEQSLLMTPVDAL